MCAVGLDPHRSRRRDAAEIVAGQVDQHDVLGRFFRVRQQAPSLARSSSWVAPRGRVPAMGRSDATSAVQFDQRLRRRTHHLQVVEVEKVHVRRRVQQPQRAVDLEGRHVGLAPKRNDSTIW